jgi:hypothetical protein
VVVPALLDELANLGAFEPWYLKRSTAVPGSIDLEEDPHVDLQ